VVTGNVNVANQINVMQGAGRRRRRRREMEKIEEEKTMATISWKTRKKMAGQVDIP
jgi:hypothetical protein